MDEYHCRQQESVLRELERAAPGAPLLALGQTVFWDEPVKAGVVQSLRRAGIDREFVAGVHDTDYFAKGARSGKSSGFEAMAHNDTTTKGLWSAAGEFSALLGSETVVSRDRLQAAGAKVGWIQSERPGFLDEVTEAWGWRGVVSFERSLKVTAEKPLGPLFPVLFRTFEWALETSLAMISGPHRRDAEEVAAHLQSMVCEASEDAGTLGDLYQRLLPKMFDLVAGEPLGLTATSTTRLLRFNSETANLPRFNLLSAFLDPRSEAQAKTAYDSAVGSGEAYTLDRFGTGAVPFDLWIPGIGRGTLRLGTKGGLVMAPKPVGFSYKARPKTPAELAAVIEKKFGPDCVLVGKAVTLIGMLAAEFVFVFHEGASGYTGTSRKFHQLLAEAGACPKLNPVLRVRYEPWQALADCCAWFKLPEPLRRPFGADELCGASFAARLPETQKKQKAILTELGTIRRPLELVRWLESHLGGQWQCLAGQYVALHGDVAKIRDSLAVLKSTKNSLVADIRKAAQDRVEAERAKGRHWREKMFDKSPTEEDWIERERLTQIADDAASRLGAMKAEWKRLQAEQDALVTGPEAAKGRQRRTDIALEAELARVRLVREAVITTDGLDKAGHRPSAWWFPLVCPNGSWYRATMARAVYRLESLI
ncbi:MAG: hypothetical protein KF884_08305 [Fimbriimonadaceae bacterium]|nr:hypothetical protein [Fimbriimonadaceae bacterium]QYK57552.1 MAG: hypothetical protein KF884_08305 [Fimbriimonadaceae bacterium]